MTSAKILSLKKMGIDNFVVARGVNPHVNIRQSAFTLDGPIIKARSAYAHEIVLSDHAAGMPAFRKIPEGVHTISVPGIDDLVIKLQAYAEDRGRDLSGATNSEYIKSFFNEFRNNLFMIWNGNEHEEMPLLTGMFGPDIDSSNDAAIHTRKCYITGLKLPDLDPSQVEHLVQGGCLGFAVDMDNTSDTGGTVIAAAYGIQTGGGEPYEGWEFFPMENWVCLQAYTKDLDGEGPSVYVDIVLL